jgi:hypothetical protein
VPFVPVPNTALVEIRMLCDSQRIENTLWFLHDDSIDATELNTLGGAVLGWYLSDMVPLLNFQVTLREIYSTDQTTATGAANTQDGGGAAGTKSGTASPNNSTIAVSFRTASRGRSFRGRNYFPLIDRDDMADLNHINASFASDIISAYNSLLGPDALVTGWTWVVASRFSGVDVDGDPIPRVSGIPTPITQVVITDLVVDSMRRRLPARGD